MFKVILLIESSRSSGREILRGITQYAHLHGPWSFYREPPSYIKIANKKTIVSWIKNIKADGVITNDHYTKKCIELIDSDISVILGGVDKKKYPQSATFVDNGIKAGEMAANYLLDLGFKNFAYYGLLKIGDFRNRGKGFAKVIEEKGFKTFFYQPIMLKSSRVWETRLNKLSKWLKDLPKPIGIMTYADDYSQQISEACKIANIRIPDEVAIIGVDNDEMVCNLAYPPLTSIALNYRKCGYKIAELLDNMMRNKEPKKKTIVIEPTYIYPRQSTHILHIEDKDVVDALQFISENANQMIQVQDVVEYTNCATRTLQKKFNKALGHPISEEIKKAKVNFLIKMLTETDLPISQIALKIGHKSVEHIARFFKREVGVSPLAYRKKHSKIRV